MNTIFTVIFVILSALVVSGSKFEAIDGENVTIYFDIDEVEKADEVRITFKEDKKDFSVLFAQKPWVYDDPPRPGVTLILGKGRLNVTIQDVDISRSGLYKAEAYTGGKVCEDTATLVVNKAPVSSTSPPHSSSSPTPPRSSELHSLYALITAVIFIILIIILIILIIILIILIILIIILIIICISCFWKQAVRNVSQHQMMTEPQKLQLSPDSVSQQNELENMIV